MPQCVDFDYFDMDCENQSTLKVTPPEGAHFKRVPGLQKVYFNHCR